MYGVVMGGTELKVQLEESQNTVKWLKLAIQDEQGISTFIEQLFLASKCDNNADASGGAGAKQEQLKDGGLVSDSSEHGGFVRVLIFQQL
jgi:hypothetical protein